MGAATKPSVLFVYYTYTQQTLKIVESMADLFRDRGCDAVLAPIEFTDLRYAHRFKQFPLAHPYRDLCGMIPPALRRTTGTIRVPDAMTARGHDLVCIGAPTLWLSTNVPIRSFLESKIAGQVLKGKRFAVAVLCRRYWRHNLKTVRRLATKCGGVFSDGIHFSYQCGQIRSLLSLCRYLAFGENRPRYLGVKIPPTNLREFQIGEARTFAYALAHQLFDAQRPGIPIQMSNRDQEKAASARHQAEPHKTRHLVQAPGPPPGSVSAVPMPALRAYDNWSAAFQPLSVCAPLGNFGCGINDTSASRAQAPYSGYFGAFGGQFAS
jgi:hypothetical protein